MLVENAARWYSDFLVLFKHGPLEALWENVEWLVDRRRVQDALPVVLQIVEDALDISSFHNARFAAVCRLEHVLVQHSLTSRSNLWLLEIDEGVAQVGVFPAVHWQVEEVVGSLETHAIDDRHELLLSKPARNVTNHHSGRRQVLLVSIALSQVWTPSDTLPPATSTSSW